MRKLAMNQPTLVLAVSLLLIDIGPLRPYASAQEATPKAEAQSVASIVTLHDTGRSPRDAEAARDFEAAAVVVPKDAQGPVPTLVP